MLLRCTCARDDRGDGGSLLCTAPVLGTLRPMCAASSGTVMGIIGEVSSRASGGDAGGDGSGRDGASPEFRARRSRIRLNIGRRPRLGGAAASAPTLAATMVARPLTVAELKHLACFAYDVYVYVYNCLYLARKGKGHANGM